MEINNKPLEKYIDHTLLKATATEDEIINLCREAKKYNFASVCVNPYFVKLAADNLKGSDVKVCTVIGFPLGATPKEVKSYEARRAIIDGADELDMVINISALKSGNYKYVEEDIKAVVNVIDDLKKENMIDKQIIVKVILETCYLTDEEIKEACICAQKAGADFVKTSTGFGSGGATVEAVKIMKEAVGNSMEIKASGGIRDFETAKKMIEAGATRIGTSSGEFIIKGGSAKESGNY